MCVRSTHVSSFYDFSIGFLNCSDSVGYCLFFVLSPRYSGACFSENIDLWSQLKDNGYLRAYQRNPLRQVMIALVM